MKPVKKSRKISVQLENRKRNLEVVEETIRSDPAAEEKLDPVKDFLSRRIESLEVELTRN
jgi:hypothetical protein